MLGKIKQTMDKHINYPAAILGASLLGAIVFAINYSHGIPLALIAASKQALYTFFAGGFITRLVERFAIKYHNAFLSVSLGTAIGVFIAVGLTFLVHSIRGTPEPVYSTLPTLILAIPGFSAIGYRARKKGLASP